MSRDPDYKADSGDGPGMNELSDRNAFLPFGDCIVDSSGRQFACIHDHCPDQSRCFSDMDLDVNTGFHELDFHPEDRNLWCLNAYPDILEFIESNPVYELKDLKLLFNHRYIQRDGNVSQFLHEGSFSLSKDSNIPVLKLNVFTELGDFKTDDSMILSIFRYSSVHGFQKVMSKTYSENSIPQLSEREMEVIKLCLEGLSSKRIADKLNISIHTVKNHKRNCMQKTYTHTIAELISFCMKSKWL